MALTFEQKQAVVKEVTDIASSSLSVVAAEYRGLTVADMSDLRAGAREAKVAVRVVKNSLAKRALQDSDFSSLNEILTGPLVLGFSQDDPGGAARVFRDFAKKNDKLQVTGLTLGAQLMDVSQLDAVANLPTYEQSLAMLMGVIKAPVDKLVRTLAEPPAKLVRTLDAVRAQKAA